MQLSPALVGLDAPVAEALAGLVAANTVERIWAGDHTLWSESPFEISDRLGWLHVLDEMDRAVSEMETFAAGARADGLVKAVLCGMGGSTLFPEVLRDTFAGGPRSPESGHAPVSGVPLNIVDTTDPAAIDRVLADREMTETLFVAASKSGSTIETRSQLAIFWERLGRGSQFTAITDAGSELAAVADRDGFRRVFQNRGDIGGRFSALSYFGLVPGALVGAPIARILQSARTLVPALQSPGSDNPGLLLGAAIGVAARSGRDKLTIVLDERIAPFGVWLEQLIAESTGKHGVGVFPIVDEPIDLSAYGTDRLVVAVGDVAGIDDVRAVGHPVIDIPLDDPTDLGAQVMLWEFATAVCGVVLGINPFDQPNVAAAKAATDRLLAEGLPDIPLSPVPSLLDQVKANDCVAILAYVDPASRVVNQLRAKRREVGHRKRVATTFGLGPRYLHSTGQLHKGKPGPVVALQIVGDDRSTVPIPGKSFDFSTLKRAQAAGDYLALKEAGARVGRVSLNEFLDW